MGVNAINNHKPLVTQDKKKVVALPGLFDVDLLGELTGEDPFIGPVRTAIINKDVQSFNKLGAYMAQFWTKAAVVINCVLIDNKLAIPEQLRSAILIRLHRSHPGQASIYGDHFSIARSLMSVKNARSVLYLVRTSELPRLITQLSRYQRCQLQIKNCNLISRIR